MSDNTHSSSDSGTQDIPRMEPWLAVSLLAFVPGIGLFVLPSSAMIPLYVAMAVLITTGIGMFLRSELGRGSKRKT